MAAEIINLADRRKSQRNDLAIIPFVLIAVYCIIAVSAFEFFWRREFK